MNIATDLKWTLDKIIISGLIKIITYLFKKIKMINNKVIVIRLNALTQHYRICNFSITAAGTLTFLPTS